MKQGLNMRKHRRITYSDYRSFGHTRLTSAVLAVPFWLFMAGAAVLGVLIFGVLQALLG